MGLTAQAQVGSYEEYAKKRKSSYATYKDNREKGIAKYKEKANEEYSRRMTQRWEYYQLRQELTPPESPEPVTPPKVSPDTPSAKPEGVKLSPAPILKPKAPSKPTGEVELPEVDTAGDKKSVAVDYYGTKVRVDYSPSMIIKLSSSDEEGVAAAWNMLADGRSNLWVRELMNLRKKLNLCDWAYNKLVEKASVALMGKTNEAVLLQNFTLVQSGLKVRLGRRNNTLCLLFPSEVPIYYYSYVTIDGLKYYVLAKKESGGLYVFDSIFPGEQIPSMQITLPELPLRPTVENTYKAEGYPNLVVTAKANVNAMEFYNECPMIGSWQSYANANLSNHLKKQLYPTLQEAIRGVNDVDAANLLINFVQTGFDYKTDNANFGHERTLYADEMFYYRYSDCEDRAILYSILVRDLLGLDVVLLNFENHIATAVRFPSDVKGDYVMVDGVKYVVCDPTYINAKVGMMMPGMGGKLENVIAL